MPELAYYYEWMLCICWDLFHLNEKKNFFYVTLFLFGLNNLFLSREPNERKTKKNRLNIYSENPEIKNVWSMLHGKSRSSVSEYKAHMRKKHYQSDQKRSSKALKSTTKTSCFILFDQCC